MSARNCTFGGLILVFIGLSRVQGSEPLPASPWCGVYPTVLTPFCSAHGGVDVTSLEKQLLRELHCGVHGLLVLGTFGEGQYTTMEERADVIATAVRLAGAVPVVAGIHTCDFDVARVQLLQARELGAQAALVKYLGNPRASFAEISGFFAALAELQVLPIIYYHYPSQTGLRLSAAEICQILSIPGIIGVKESILDLCEMKRHLHHCRDLGKAYFSSSALNLTQFLDLGGQGFMCPEAVLEPGPVVQAYEAYRAGRHAEARYVQKQLFVLTPIMRTRPTSPALSRVTLMTAEDLRLPLPMSRDQPQAKMKAALNGFGVPTPTHVKCPLPALTPWDQRTVQAAVDHCKGTDWNEAAFNTPPEPSNGSHEKIAGGALLRTGAFQLGPGVAHDLLRSQGDGLWGFPIPGERVPVPAQFGGDGRN